MRLLIKLGVLWLLWVLFVLGMVHLAHASKIPYNRSEMAILAIIGEGSSESFRGQVAIGESIRKRGGLKGVYGVHSKRIKEGRYSKKEYNTAKRAWLASANTNYSKGADGWGNEADLAKFKGQKWFKGCYIVCKIGKHFFWKKHDTKKLS